VGAGGGGRHGEIMLDRLFHRRVPNLLDGEMVCRVIANGVSSAVKFKYLILLFFFFECGASHRAIHAG
jgi:hypothetical protein